MQLSGSLNKKLLVEGNDDQHVIWALCKRFNIYESFEVIDCNGISNLINQLPVRFKESGITSLGIIVDADTDLINRWNSVKDILVKQGYTPPAAIPGEGLVLETAGNIRVGVWIMPNNNLNGMLEDFITFLVPKDDKLLPIVNSTLDSIEEQKLNKYAAIHRSKAVIHSWLAWQEDPGTPLGAGITKRYLTTDEETCSLLIKWLNKLFNS